MIKKTVIIIPLITAVFCLGSCAKKPIIKTTNSDEWKVFRGAWFDIRYPQNFRPRPSLKSPSAPGSYDSVFFISSDGLAEFYVFSPQLGGSPIDILPRECCEEIVLEKKESPTGKNIRWVTLKAADSSYQRSFVDVYNTVTNTRHAFAIKYSSRDAWQRYEKEYNTFMQSLVQFGDQFRIEP
jgi:hypothetical protein